MPRLKFTPSQTPTEQKVYLNAREAAQMLSVKPTTVCKLINRGELKGGKVGKGYLVPRTAIDVYIGTQIERQTTA